MIVARTIAECRAARARLGVVAFVPTMGALHAGHLSLVEHGRRRAPAVAVSIFVNPTQFGPGEDFQRYPRPLEDDLARCRDAGVELVFVPTAAEMYPPDAARATLDVPALTGLLEGEHRPGHFAGVCQVVAKLFHVVQPDFACFGEKDFQQLAVLSAMTRAMDFPVTIVPCPTLRDPDGLAMSSRNRYLSPAERERALSISRTLFAIADRARAGERDIAAMKTALHDGIFDPRRSSPAVPVRLDYATIVDVVTLREIASLDRPARALVAARVGSTRLIDNVPLAPH